jgi:hypothetical protein
MRQCDDNGCPWEQRGAVGLTAYLDESGSNPNDPILTLAGFISDEQR